MVEENQSAFIPGRAITDNILLTQELLKGYNCINGPKRMSFKIDIQKAYDTVNWEFIEEIMIKFGFPRQMVDWIMVCITTSKFTICVNGERHGYFKGGRGLRQGDPISPYIFTLVMEMLNLIVKDEIKKDGRFKYHFGCKQLKITHLCFVDDLIMLCHGGMDSVNVLKKALNRFSDVSGLYPNLGKYTMFYGSIDEGTKNTIKSVLPFKEGKLLVRYLGVPLVTKKIGVADCKQLVDNVQKKLNDWKNKSLSYAGRAQLIASVLSSMQIYWGSVFLLPKSIIEDIEKLFKRFLWNCGDSCRGKARVAWKDVCKPKDQGGLGFKSLEMWNRVLLVKHLWNVASRKESLWVKWVNVVKLKNRSVWDVTVDNNDSWFWKNILKFRDWVGKNMRYQIGKGKTINVWHDIWKNDQRLSTHISKKDIFYAGLNDTDKLADVIDDSGWKWPAHWSLKYPIITNLEVPELNNMPDKAVWIDKNGNVKDFATSTVWKDVRSEDDAVRWKSLVWYSHCIPKHAFILWLAVKNKLCTQDKLQKWYPNKVYECSLCKNGLDSHNHLFFECEYSKEVWGMVSNKAKIHENEDTWEGIVNKMSSIGESRSVWEIIKKLCLAATVYHIWQERNGRLFGGNNSTAETLFNVICEDIRAKLVTVKVRQCANVLDAETIWNVKFGKKIQ